MKRLLWKEYREKRLFGLALCSAAIAPILMGTGYTFSGPVLAFTPWCVLPVWVAFFLGAGAYSSEITGGAADFMCSRPVSWKRLLGAKLLMGLVLVVGTGVIAAAIYRMDCAPQYARFATPERLVLGVCYAAVLLEGAYLCGAACSLALPGTAGALLTFILLVVLSILQSLVYDRAHWSLFGWILGPAIAAVLVARFGVTLPTGDRFRRYALVTVIAVALLIPLDFLVGGPKGNGPVEPRHADAVVSPDARYAISPGSKHITRLRDGASGRLPAQLLAIDLTGAAWTPDDAAVFLNGRLAWKVWMDTGGAVRYRSAALTPVGANLRYLSSSPDRRLAIVNWWALKRLSARSTSAAKRPTQSQRSLRVLDLESLKPVGPVVIGARDFWWQSDDQVGYIDARGGRHIVRVRGVAREENRGGHP